MQRIGPRLGVIALIALLVRAVVPAGYMLAHAETSEGRYLTIEMCEGHARPQVIDLDTGKLVDPSQAPAGAPDSDRSEGKSAPCVFASAAQLAPPLLVAHAVDFLVSYEPGFIVRHDIRPGRGIAAPPPPATGPPSAT